MEHSLLREGQVDALPPVRRFRFTGEIVVFADELADDGGTARQFVQDVLGSEGVEVIAVEELL